MSTDSGDSGYHEGHDAGPLTTVQRVLDPMQAQILRSLLEAEGIPAYTADGQLVQTNMLWAIALGGVRIQVPEALLPRAREVIAAMEAGRYALEEGAEVPGDGAAP